MTRRGSPCHDAGVRRILVGGWLGLALGSLQCERVNEDTYACTAEDAHALFDRRIAPLLADDRVTSCNECHLSGIDLSLYVGEDPCATMACMVESGIVDLSAPDDSLVLDWVLRADPGSELITPEVIKAEHDAVREWIEYNARCGDLVCDATENPCGRRTTKCEVPNSSPSTGRRPFENPGDCSDATIESAFATLVYSWRGRCEPCHYSGYDGAPEEAPRWIVEGDCSLGAVKTMRGVIASGLVDPNDPTQSLLLLKPLNKIPHGGHAKMAGPEDPSYLDFLTWIELWAACQ